MLNAVLQRTTQRAVADRVSVSQAAVAFWASGETRPAYKARKVLLAAYEIDIDAWEREPARVPVAIAA